MTNAVVSVAVWAMQLTPVAIVVGMAKALTGGMQAQSSAVGITVTLAGTSETIGSRLTGKAFTSHVVTSLSQVAVAVKCTLQAISVL